jgi:hypothetical protein
LQEPRACPFPFSFQYLRHIKNTDEFWDLQRSLCIGAGLKVTITQNVSLSAGLTNGACGIILHMHYETGKSPPDLPQFVLLKMESNVPSEWHGVIFPDHPQLANVVPLFPITAPCDDHCCTRQQYPLAMAAASTIHRAQGRTITTKYALQVKASDETKWPGIIYTALTRFRTMTDFTLMSPFTPKHFENLRKKLAVTGRKKEMDRLLALARRTEENNTHILERDFFEQLLERLSQARHREQ